MTLKTLQSLNLNNFSGPLPGTKAAAASHTAPVSSTQHITCSLPKGTQTWEFPCLSRKAARCEVCGTERGTLPSSIQFNPVVILTATPVQDICLDLQVILAAKPNSRLDEPGFSCSKVISNPSPDMKPNNSDTCQVQISNYLTLFLLGKDRRSSSEHARSHQLPCSLLSPRDKAKAGTEAATGISLPIFPSQLPSILHSVLLVSL